MIVDSAIYVDGHRSASCPLEKTREALRERGGFAWIALYEPTEDEIASVAGELGLHELAVRDTVAAHQRPKVERYGDSLFVVLKAARYVEEKETVEVEVFSGHPSVSRRIYELSREVIQFHQATHPLAGALTRLTGGENHDIDPGVRRYLRDVQDRVLRVTERVEGFRELLTNILSVNLTQISIDQNNQVKKISAWAAILVVPTLITGIYGMNFDHMPELHWIFGYPFALLLMLIISVILYRTFRRSGWL